MSINEARSAVFLCGPITDVTSNETFDAKVRHLIEGIAERLETAGFQVFSAHQEESFGSSIPERPADVYNRDWRFAQMSDAMVVVFPSDIKGGLIRTDGTFMELGWAMALYKPLSIVTDPKALGRSYLFDGLLGSSNRVHRYDFEDAIKGNELIVRLQRELSEAEQPNHVVDTASTHCPSCGFNPASDSTL